MLPDTWYARDLPVLEACVSLVDENPGIGATVPELSAASGVTEDGVKAALRALEAAGLIGVLWGLTSEGVSVPRVAGEARRLAGAWPTPETAADRLVAALEAQIAATTEPEERGRLELLLAGVAGVGRDVLVAVLSKALTG